MRWILPLLSAALLLVGHDDPRRSRAFVALNGISAWVPLEDLGTRVLSTDGLKDDADLVADLELGPPLVNAFTKIVECALDPTQSLTVHFGGQDVVFKGAMAFWPAWGSGPCNEQCQEEVSGCFLARWNDYGVPVKLLFVGDPTYGGNPDAAAFAAYPIEEGAFFGNFFQGIMYSCRGTGYDPLLTTLRVCSRHDCSPMQFLGSCADHCEIIKAADDADEIQYFPCYFESRGPDGFPANSHGYKSVTAHLKRSQMGTCP